MYIGISKRLKVLGGLRIGVGKRLSGTGGLILLCCCAFINLFWYMILGCLWTIYGLGYLVYLPIKAIVNATKRKQEAEESAEV